MSRPLIKESLAVLNVAGTNPTNQNAFSKIRYTLSAIIMIFLGVDICLNLYYHWKKLQSMEDIATMLGAYQVTCKIILMVAYQKRFLTLFGHLDKFKPLDRYDDESRKQIDAISTTFRKFAKTMFCIVFLMLFFYYSRPFFSSTKVLPFHTYHPTNLDSLPLYVLGYCFDLAVAVAALPCLIGFDMLFVALIINISWEFRILKMDFESLTMIQDNINQLHKLIDHHNLVLQCIKDMDQIYRIFLLNTFALNMVLICVALLSILASGFPPSIQTFSHYGLFLIFFTAQLFFYCVTGTYLTSESENISAAVFGTNWWIKTQPGVRRACSNIIQRANKTEMLTAGGMLYLNLATFMQVLNTAFSFFTLVKAAYQVEN